MEHDPELHDHDHDDPRLEPVGEDGAMPDELVDDPGNLPGDQPEDQRPPSPATSGYRDDPDDEPPAVGAVLHKHDHRR